MDATGVAAVWSDRLDGRAVDPDDDFFFDLGGTSLLAVAIVAGVAEKSGLPLELRDLYLAPTPRELAAYLGELAGRLASLRAREWSLDVVAEALADLGSAAADSLLPRGARVSFGGAAPASGPARVGALRRARGNGACSHVPGSTAVRRQDAVVRLSCAAAAGGPVIHLEETTESAG
jgi:acyl carrier protein